MVPSDDLKHSLSSAIVKTVLIACAAIFGSELISEAERMSTKPASTMSRRFFPGIMRWLNTLHIARNQTNPRSVARAVRAFRVFLVK